jgi:hypothetical protein
MFLPILEQCHSLDDDVTYSVRVQVSVRAHPHISLTFVGYNTLYLQGFAITRGFAASTTCHGRAGAYESPFRGT